MIANAQTDIFFKYKHSGSTQVLKFFSFYTERRLKRAYINER